MITSIQFKNFRVLRDATLPLGPFTLIVGPNGSGKSTAMRAIRLIAGWRTFGLGDFSMTGRDTGGVRTEIHTIWSINNVDITTSSVWAMDSNRNIYGGNLDLGPIYAPNVVGETDTKIRATINGFRIFSFDANSIATATRLVPRIELASDGANLAGVLDNLRDMEPERFEALNAELGRWLPEFDRILFETPEPGFRAFLLRTRNGRHKIRAADLSQGTLLALAFLTLAYLPSPPPIVCFEEPERGIHPRLLREIQDSMYRLAYPESYSEQRQPVQVIATTHSPYLLDLYKDHPEEIVIAQKDEGGARFERLSDKPNIDEFLQDASLGDVWYSGVLGGVPNTP